MTTCPFLISDPGTWDGATSTFHPWWMKIKLWATAQIQSGYTKANIGQAVLTCMHGNAKEWAMQLIDQYETNNWSEWLDVTFDVNEDAVTTPGLWILIK